MSEIFIAGVPLFLFVSGFLAGKREIENVGKWWLGKIRRLIIPVLFFVVFIYGLYSITGIENVSPFQWIFTLCNLQGLNYTYWKFNLFGAVSGMGHLWFITTIMICYILVPLMQKFKKIKLKAWQKGALIVIVLLLQLVLMYVGLQLSYIITFFFGYFIAGEEVRTDTTHFSFLTLATLAICGIRIVLKSRIDGGDFYDRYYALISVAFIAVWIFYAMYFVKSRMPKLFDVINCPALRFTENISYYFYLIHYLFLSGRLAVFKYVDNRLLAHILALIFSYLSASIFYLLIEKGLFKVLKRSKK